MAITQGDWVQTTIKTDTGTKEIGGRVVAVHTLSVLIRTPAGTLTRFKTQVESGPPGIFMLPMWGDDG